MSRGERVYFPFYFSFYETAQTMPPRMRAAFYEAIISYAVAGTNPQLPKSISGYWPIVKPMLDNAKAHYNAGKKGGIKPKNSDFGSDISETNGLEDTETKGCNKEKEKEKEKKEYKEKGADAPPAPPKSKRFAPPELTEVKAYFAEKGGADTQAERFCAYYESNGWKVGRNPMKDWKAAARGWLARDKEQYPARDKPKAPGGDDWKKEKVLR